MFADQLELPSRQLATVNWQLQPKSLTLTLSLNQPQPELLQPAACLLFLALPLEPELELKLSFTNVFTFEWGPSGCFGSEAK